MTSPFFALLVWTDSEKFFIDECQKENEFFPHSVLMFDCKQI